MFFLPWWTYVLIGTAAFTCAYAGIWLANIAEPGIRQDDEDGPFPCLSYMGRDVYMGELWCWLLYGHDGEHEDQSELPDTAFTREWPEDTECFCGSVGAGECDRLRQLDAAGNLVIDDRPADMPCSDEEDVLLPPLPQRLSKVPVQTEHNDPWPLCGRDDCQRSKGHPGLCTG